ncbi:hypothetical protein ACLBWA_08795, partial [Pseudomonas aeruginosa]
MSVSSASLAGKVAFVQGGSRGIGAAKGAPALAQRTIELLQAA